MKSLSRSLSARRRNFKRGLRLKIDSLRMCYTVDQHKAIINIVNNYDSNVRRGAYYAIHIFNSWLKDFKKRKNAKTP